MVSKHGMSRAMGWLVVLCSIVAAEAQAEIAAGELTESSMLSDYLRVAAAESPLLRSRYEEWMAAVEGVGVVEGWPDPTVSYTAFLRPVETALGPQQHAIGLSQTLPWFGKRSLRGDAAEQGALAAEQRFHQARLDLFARTARAYYDYAYLAQAVQVTRENRDLMRYQESVARAKYKTDTARYSELVKAQVELGVLEDQLRTLEDQRVSSTAALNVALGRPARSPLPWPVPLDDPPLEIPDDEMVRALALQDSPALLAAQHEVDQRARTIDAAGRDRYPDITLGVSTTLIGESKYTGFPDQGRDAWMGTVSLRLPLWQGKYRAAIREAQARERAAQYGLEDRQRQLEAQVDARLFELHDAQRKIELYGSNLVLKAEQALQAVDTAYRAGEATFLDFVDAERTLLRFQLDLARARADWGRHTFEVAALMGREAVAPPAYTDEEGDPR